MKIDQEGRMTIKHLSEKYYGNREIACMLGACEGPVRNHRRRLDTEAIGHYISSLRKLPLFEDTRQADLSDDHSPKERTPAIKAGVREQSIFSRPPVPYHLTSIIFRISRSTPVSSR